MNTAFAASLPRPSTQAGGWILALVASIGLVWLASGSGLLALAYAGGLVTFSALLFVGLRGRSGAFEGDLAPPDWSVTATAIARPDQAIAITDRANRLVCANARFAQAWGTAAPPALDCPRESVETLTRLAREAWRDGSAVAPVALGEAREAWEVATQRAGRADDYLVWHFRPRMKDDALEQASALLSGRLGALLGRAGIDAAVVGADGTVRTVSAGFAERAAGDSTATLAGQDFASLLRSDDRDRIYFAREGRDGAPHGLIHVPLADEGANLPGVGEAPSLMLLLESGVGLGTGEAAPADTAPQLESLLAALPMGLGMTDRDGRFLFANEAFLRAIGREREGLPQYPSDIVVREDKAPLADAVRRFGKGAANSGDFAARLRHAPDEPVSIGLAGVRGLGEAAVLLSIADTREEGRLRREMAQATKMQAVGQLAGGVAHDFNNVLTAIIGYCDLMLLRHTPGDGDYDDIQQIKTNSNRAASLTRQLLAFSRQQTLRPEVLQLPDIVSEVSQLLRRLLGEKIELVVRHDRDLGAVRADPGQMEQVIVNLAVNARDAIQGAGATQTGRVIMSTRRVSAKDVRNMGAEILPVADYTALIVQDSGGGIPPEVIGKIFEPFFTTKEQGKGTGLGLATVYGIVKQSGGFIFADNSDGTDGQPRGARFTIYLPVHRGAPAAKPARRAEPEEPPPDWSAGGRILLVEDEDTVRMVAERALVRAGFTVTACADGEEGVAAIEASEHEFDLVVTDVVMPGMDGPAMVRRIRGDRPRLPVLFMSGYAEEQLRSEIDVPDMHFLAKPFNVQQISEKVGSVLRAAREAG